jgi:hypothetical protein
MRNGQPLLVHVDLCDCKEIPAPSELGRATDTTLSPTDWKCVTRVPQMQAFPDQAVGGADRHVAAQALQVRLEKNYRIWTMEAIPVARSPRHARPKTQGSVPNHPARVA